MLRKTWAGGSLVDGSAVLEKAHKTGQAVPAQSPAEPRCASGGGAHSHQHHAPPGAGKQGEPPFPAPFLTEAHCCRGNRVHPGSWAAQCGTPCSPHWRTPTENYSSEKGSSYKTPLFTESALNHVHTQHVKQTLATGMLKLLTVMKKVVEVIKCRAALAELHLLKPSYLQHSSFKFVLQAKFCVILYILNGIKEGTLKMFWVYFPPHWTIESFNGSIPGNTEKL